MERRKFITGVLGVLSLPVLGQGWMPRGFGLNAEAENISLPDFITQVRHGNPTVDVDGQSQFVLRHAKLSLKREVLFKNGYAHSDDDMIVYSIGRDTQEVKVLAHNGQAEILANARSSQLRDDIKISNGASIRMLTTEASTLLIPLSGSIKTNYGNADKSTALKVSKGQKISIHEGGSSKVLIISNI